MSDITTRARALHSVADEEAARRDRARYCHATGTGPRWARELGAAMARGEA